MTKPSRQKEMNVPDNPVEDITAECKKLLERPQTEEIKKKIRELRRRYLKRIKDMNTLLVNHERTHAGIFNDLDVLSKEFERVSALEEKKENLAEMTLRMQCFENKLLKIDSEEEDKESVYKQYIKTRLVQICDYFSDQNIILKKNTIFTASGAIVGLAALIISLIALYR